MKTFNPTLGMGASLKQEQKGTHACTFLYLNNTKRLFSPTFVVVVVVEMDLLAVRFSLVSLSK